MTDAHDAQGDLLTEHLDLYTPAQRWRHDVRPGITRLAQVNGRNALTRDEKLASTPSVGPKRLFACDACGWRGRREPLDFGGVPMDLSEQTPDVRDIDAAVSTIPLLRQWAAASHPIR